MSLPAWREEPISRRHDRAAFDCGDAALNEFLQRHARKSHELGGAKTFVAAEGALHQFTAVEKKPSPKDPNEPIPVTLGHRRQSNKCGKEADNMALQKGEVYRCANKDCGCEITVTKGAAPGMGGDQSPRCCCGKEMKKA